MQAVEPLSTPPPGGIFRCVMPVRWGDLDALNHVNNTVYFHFFEEARAQLFSVAGIVSRSKRETVLAHASCDFLRPLTYPATIVVSFVLLRVGTSSMEVEALIERQGEPGVLYAKGRNVIVGTDPGTGKSMAWSVHELAQLTALFVKS